MELVSIGGRDQRLLEARRDFHGASIRVEKRTPKVTKLDGIETIDSLDQPRSNRATEDVKRMRRDSEKRLAPAPAQLVQIVQAPERFYFACAYVEQNDVGALETNLGGGNEKNAHPGSIREDLRAIENGVVQSNSEDAKPERTGALEQLMRRVIERILRIVERVNVEVDLDPIDLLVVGIRLHLSNLWFATREATGNKDFSPARNRAPARVGPDLANK